MDKMFEQFNQLKRAVKLDPSRKQVMRDNLARIVELTPVREGADIRLIQQRSSVAIHTLKLMPVVAVIAILVLAGGGASVAAEGALPGDTLYPLKLVLNEEVRAFVALTPEAKAEWEARRAERRLEEAARLAVKSQIDAEVRAKLEERFEAFADRVEVRITEMEARGKVRSAVDVASRFETALRAHQEILAALEERGLNVESLELKVRLAKDSIKKARVELESRVASANGTPETRTAAEGKLKAAENVIVSARAVIENRKAKLGAEAVAKANEELGEAEELVVEGKAKLTAGAYGEAFNLGNKAIRVAQEARTLIEIQNQLGISAKIDIEDEDDENGVATSTRGGSGVRGRGEVEIEIGF